MRLSLFVLLLLLITLSVQAQDKKYPDSVVAKYIAACQCVFKIHGDPNKQKDWDKTVKGIKQYDGAFRRAEKILFISYKAKTGQNAAPYLKEGELNHDEIIEEKELNDG